jgi:hypothetical protein
MLDPMTYGALSNLKDFVRRGTERGPIYDQGILEVVATVEGTGSFRRGGIAGIIKLMDLQRRTIGRMVANEEAAEGERFLAARSWTIDEGLQYANGVRFAEEILKMFEATRTKSRRQQA